MPQIIFKFMKILKVMFKWKNLSLKHVVDIQTMLLNNNTFPFPVNIY